MKRFFLAGTAICGLLVLQPSAHATLAYDASLVAPPGLYFGSGNENVGFTVDTENGVEIGLSAINRYIGPITPTGNEYDVATGDTSVAGKSGSIWGVDFSIYALAGSGLDLGDLTATLTVTDLNTGVSDAALTPNPLAIPDNTCTDGANKVTCGPSAAGAQNSEAGSFLPAFGVDPGFQDWLPDTYTYTLTVSSATGTVLATDTIILNAVPEPGSIAIFATGLAGLGLAWRRRRSAMIG
jgi:hypothetical protein